MTDYYSLAGTFTKNGEPVTDRAEIHRLVLNWIEATRAHRGSDGFQFVDADAHATISEGFVSLNWSDYGLDLPPPLPVGPAGAEASRPDAGRPHPDRQGERS